MAATVLVRDVLHRAAVILNDTAPQWIRVPEKSAVDFLNDAQLALAKFAPWTCSVIIAMKLKAGTRQSIETIVAADAKLADGTQPGANILGTQFLEAFRNAGADGLTPGKALRLIAREDLESLNPNWHTAASTNPPECVMFDPRFPLHFWNYPPVPATPARWIEIGANVQPAKIANTGTPGSELYTVGTGASTLISTRDEYVDDLVNYIVARAHMMDTNWSEEAKAVAFTNLFLSSLNANVQAHTGVNPNLKQLPFAPQPLGAAK